MAEKNIIIIGGGLAGVTSFYELQSRGRSCTLIEAEDGVGLGTSFANGAVLHPSHPDPWNSPGIGPYLLSSLFNKLAPIRIHWSQIFTLMGWGATFIRHSSIAHHEAITDANFKLAEYSTRATAALQTSAGLDFDMATPGTVKLLYNDDQRRSAVRMADRLSAYGLRYEALTRDGLLAREPTLSDMHVPPVGGLYFPDDMIGDAHLFCQELRRVGEAAGGVVRCGTLVSRVMSSHGRVTGVMITDRNTGEASALHGDVVICAGTASPSLVKSVGVDLPIRPAKGYSITFDASDAPTHPVIDPQLHVAVTPLAGKMRVLGMAEFAGIDRQIEPARIAMLQQIFGQMFPKIEKNVDWARAKNWTGLRPMSSDGRPFIGASGVDGLWLNCGHGHLGWTMALGSSRLLVDQMLGQRPEIDPAPFAVSKKRQDLFKRPH